MKHILSTSLLALLGFAMKIGSLPLVQLHTRSAEMREINRRLDSIGSL